MHVIQTKWFNGCDVLKKCSRFKIFTCFDSVNSLLNNNFVKLITYRSNERKIGKSFK